jgi:site-specific DNA-adenine methylase
MGNTTSLRPFFPYYGSKWNIARYYPKPTHDLVIEAFAGAAGYATYYGCRQVQLIDVDPIIAGVWSYLIKASVREIMALPELPDVGDCVDDYDISQEAKWLIGFWLNRGSATPKKTRTAYSARVDKAQLVWGARAKQRIATQLSAIRDWKVTSGSYEDIPNVEATWYVDPPYTDKGRYYRKSFDDFDRLGRWCVKRNGMVIVCEGAGAEWLPFEPLGDFKTSLGRACEAIFVQASRRQRRPVYPQVLQVA